jgi:PTS system nitrogen regulatory IIA component
MDLNVRDVARLLGVTEDAVYAWIRKGEIPSHRVHDQHWFNRVELQEWASARKMRLSPAVFAPVGGSMATVPRLRDALERGGIFHRVSGDTRRSALQAVTELPGIPRDVVRPQLLELLESREALASTGVGEGIALPHARDPLVVSVDEPTVLLCFLEQPVDFGAIDGLAVNALFLLLSPTVRAHLQLLARIAYAVHDAELKRLVREQAPREPILDRIAALEHEAPPGSERGSHR